MRIAFILIQPAQIFALMNYRKVTIQLALCLWLWGLQSLVANPYSSLETFINQHVQQYQLRPDHLFRLSAYTELRGDFSRTGEVRLDFETLGSLSFYADNMLLRTADQHVYHLNRGAEVDMTYASAINQALDEVFEGILLLSNGNASPAHVAFVDEQLSRKNLDPFHKLFLRYVLLHHSRWDSAQEYVEFYTGWLPSDEEYALLEKDGHLGLQLSRKGLRGYYLRVGTRVYLDDVDGGVSYATGETGSPNVTVFKSFLQDLMGHSVHYLIDQSKRIPAQQVTIQTFQQATGSGEGSSNEAHQLAMEPLYHQYHWIPMMLGMLRAKDISFGDPEVVRYFVDEPYFQRIYSQLTEAERRDVDEYLEHLGHRRQHPSPWDAAPSRFEEEETTDPSF